jgi:hypothetical protein
VTLLLLLWLLLCLSPHGPTITTATSSSSLIRAPQSMLQCSKLPAVQLLRNGQRPLRLRRRIARRRLRAAELRDTRVEPGSSGGGNLCVDTCPTQLRTQLRNLPLITTSLCAACY